MQISNISATTRLDPDHKVRKTLGVGELPVAPSGERVLLLPNPATDVSDGGIILPETAKMRGYSGRVVAAGLDALDKLYDHGIEIGDEVWWGKYAGVIEEWDHLVQPGTGPCAEHSWSRAAAPPDGAAFKCSLCEAVRWVEPLIVANCDDLLGSVQLAERLRTGAVYLLRGKAEDGRTVHAYVRAESQKENAS